jgi:hypothetical protein
LSFAFEDLVIDALDVFERLCEVSAAESWDLDQVWERDRVVSMLYDCWTTTAASSGVIDILAEY